MSIFIKIDILKPSLIKHFKKKVSIIINIDEKFGNYAIYIKNQKNDNLKKGGIKMCKKNFSKVRKTALLGFLLLFVMSSASQMVFAGTGEGFVFNKNLKLSINAGITMISEKLVSEQAKENILLIIHIHWPWPGPEPPWPEFTLEVGYNVFQWNLGIPGLNEKFHWWNVNPTMRLTFGKGHLKPYLSAGPGLYFPKEGNARLGFKGGLGIDFQLSEKFMIEMGADYHYISLKEDIIWGKSFNFFHSHAGMVIIL